MRQAFFPRSAIATALVSALTAGLWQSAAIAHPLTSVSRFTSPQFQRLSRDLNPSRSEDFFRQGREKFERDIRALSDNRQPSDDNLLKITRDRQIQDDILKQENRNQ